MNEKSSLCVRSLDVSQGTPFLQEAWDKIKQANPMSDFLLLDQPLTESVSLKGAATDTACVLNTQYNQVVSWSIPNERTIEDITSFNTKSSIPGPLNAVYRLSDKRATKVLFEQYDLPTPSWEILDREFTRGELIKGNERVELECRLLNHLSFPLVVKPLWNCMGHGVEVIFNEEDLSVELSKNGNQSILVEKFIDGDLGCIEIIGKPGSYFFQPPCLTGHSKGGAISNFDTIRVSHENLFKLSLSLEIKNKLINLLTSLQFSGACCVDFISNESGIYLLEINPRISGISCLSSAASGVNSFEATYLISTHQWGEDTKPEANHLVGAIQLGGVSATKAIHYIRNSNSRLKVYRDNIITVDDYSSHSAIIGGDLCDIESLLLIIESLD